MKKSQEFDNILDKCLERLLTKGETVEQCLQSYPEQADELESLLLTALAAKQASAIQPRPEFKARARYQFHSALRQAESRKSRSFFAWQPRWATVLVVVLVFLLASGSTVAAAGNSMPDEPLYQVKLATERVRLGLTPSDLGKAELYAKFADKRVIEIVRMAEEGKPEQVERATQRLDAHLAMIGNLASTQEERAEVLLAPPPGKARGPSERGGPGKPGPTKKAIKQAELKAALGDYAIRHPAALRAALEKAPESAKPALRRAITRSVAGYKRVLKALD